MAVWYAVGCNAVGLAVPPNERSDFWGPSIASVVELPFKGNPTTHRERVYVGDSFLLEKTGKILNEKTGKITLLIPVLLTIPFHIA